MVEYESFTFRGRNRGLRDPCGRRSRRLDCGRSGAAAIVGLLDGAEEGDLRRQQDTELPTAQDLSERGDLP